MSTAVMVDLGWPWWVTSFAAAAVVVLAAWVGIRSRSGAVRAVAALLVLQGLAIAIAAPIVMEDEDGNGNRTAMSGEAGSGLDREEFARRADENCGRLREFISSLGSPTSSAGIARQMDRVMPEFWNAYAAQARLAPHPEYEADAAEWMSAMAAVGSDFEALRSGAKRDDEALMKSANDQLAEDSGASARLSRRLGMKVCFS